MKKVQVNEITREYEPCSDTSICSQDVQDSPKQPSNLGEYKQLSLWKSTPMHKQSCDRISHISPSAQTSEATTQSQENLTLSQWDSPAQARVTQEISKGCLIQPHHSGEKDLDVSLKLNPSSVLWNNLKELSDEDLELFLPPSIWQDTLLRLKQSRRESLDYRTRDSDCLFFPTLTSNECFTSRPAGQTKCEKWFRDKGLIPSGYQLGTRAIALMMGFPSNWFEVLSQKNSKNLIIQNQVKPQEELGQDISQVEQLHQHKQRSPLEEFSISIPCLVKQPKQPEIKGVIQKDLGDRFLVNIGDEAITISKLFVYPDFAQSDEQIDELLQGGLNKSSSKNTVKSHQKVSDTSAECSSKTILPSTKSSSKRCDPADVSSAKERAPRRRRKKGEGSGHIYYRTVTRNGKEYQQAYYQWRENGKQRTKYIPKKLLDKVEEAEYKKYPVTKILELLQGGLNKCSSKKSDTCPDREVLAKDKSVETISNCSSKNTSPPSKRQKRPNGHGGGYIEYREVKRNHKTYAQYWYHWEIWSKGDRLTKKSRYIPKRLLAKIEKMNNDKVPVEEILRILKERNKRGK